MNVLGDPFPDATDDVAFAGMLLLMAVACALSSRVSAAYDDKFARNQMLYLSAAAYSTTPATCLANVIPGANVSQFNVSKACSKARFPCHFAPARVSSYVWFR